MSTQSYTYPLNGIPTYANAAALPSSASDGDVAIALDTHDMYVYETGTGWVILAVPGGGGVTSLNTLTGAVVLAAGSNISLTPSGNTVTIAATGGGANTSLSNLSSTAVNASINPNAAGTLNLGNTTSPWANVVSELVFGVARVSALDSGNNEGVFITTESNIPSGASANGLTLGSSLVSPETLGIWTPNNNAANATATQDINIETGNKLAGTGNSGNINIKPGTSSGGLRGIVQVNALDVKLLDSNSLHVMSTFPNTWWGGDVSGIESTLIGQTLPFTIATPDTNDASGAASLFLSGGNATNATNGAFGGSVYITAGDGVTDSGGASVVVSGGNTTGSGQAGGFFVTTGNSTGGDGGNFVVSTGTGGNGPGYMILNSDGGMSIKQTGTPNIFPNSGFNKIYTKSDVQLYIQDLSGYEYPVGNGWLRYTASYTDFSIAGASNEIMVGILPPYTYVSNVLVKHSASFTGGATASANIICKYTPASTGINQLTSTFNVFQAPSDTAVIQDVFPYTIATYSGTLPVYMELTISGDTINNLTSGSCTVYLQVSKFQ